MPQSASSTSRTPEARGIADRRALIERLLVACELEQGLYIPYLFTTCSLKDDAVEGLNGAALSARATERGSS